MNSEKDLSVLRHSAAHLLAHAIKELYPSTLLTIGPATKEGFFYDFLPEKNFKDEDLVHIQERMHALSAANIPLTHKQISKDTARDLYQHNPFKLELINEIPGDTVGLAEQGDFYDLCRGGHVASTGDIKHFKLLHISGSYWRADKENTPLQRITGTAFFTQEDLQAFLQQREDAIQFDHRRLGKELDLFSFHEEGVGFPFFHPRGTIVLNELKAHVRKYLRKAHYQELSTPIMLSDELWRRSGHYQHYKDNMYFSIVDGHSYALKPMNCPAAILVYKERPHSYRELPLRWSDFGKLHRHELSGVLSGLFRVRAFSQDDAHIFCTKDQIEKEIMDFITVHDEVLQPFNFSNVVIGVSTRPAKAMGSDELWDVATKALTNALDKAGKTYAIYEGEGAFYGPKIEFGLEDSLKRVWQCGTIQVDFFQPENFDLSYISSEGTKERPVMLHRAIYGSFERFFGIILEHFKGRLPFWLSPVQMKILTITDEQKEYAHGIMNTLFEYGVRVEIDTSSDPIAGQIKRAQLERVPLMVVIGKKEMENKTITLRDLDGKQQFGLSFEDLLQKIDMLTI
ncbi:MAG TPA: threonine--tRNA ligase [Candidatus Babeliales bacterium]|jgi:threonyl-tRNA synthetase|nr:threonine--tRNA ligase [Candidatus Babeliales bacterium]